MQYFPFLKKSFIYSLTISHNLIRIKTIKTTNFIEYALQWLKYKPSSIIFKNIIKGQKKYLV